jgi:predicted DNA-binding transcriptional regulator YafY
MVVLGSGVVVVMGGPSQVNRSSPGLFLRHPVLVRADRLLAALMLLQARGRVTAAEVAGELEVSERTARRDLEALAVSGVPVYSTQGRGGGWELVGGARTDLTGLTVEEARALFLAAGPGSAGSPATAPAVQAALRKLLAALPAPFREGARAAGSALVVDAAAWGRGAPPPPPWLAPLQKAVLDGEQVVLGYTGRNREHTSREVSPLGLVSKGTVWYLVAGTDAGVRTFRVDRVDAVEPTGRPVVRPEGFDLARAWASSVAEVEERRAGARVRGLADPALLPALRGRLGERLRVGDRNTEGQVEVEVSGPTVGFLAAELAGLGRRLELVDPPEARALLRALAEELADLYAEAREPADQTGDSSQPRKSATGIGRAMP